MVKSLVPLLTISLLGVALVLPGAKDCPSPLYANLRDIADSGFSWGLEGRGFFYHANGQDFFFGGASLVMLFDKEAASGEIEMVYKPKPDVPCGDEGDISPFQIRRLNGEFRLSSRMAVRVGRQAMAAGTGMLLDDFFDGAVLSLGRKQHLRIGGGVYARTVAREALGCQKCNFYTYKSCWKDLWNQEWGDTGMAFLAWEFPLGRQRLELTVIRGLSTDPRFRNTSAGLSGHLRMGPRWRMLVETGIQYSDGGGFSVAAAAELFRNWRISGLGNLTLRIRLLTAPDPVESRILPLFGNLYLGDRQHYSLRQGTILGVGFSWIPRFYSRSRLEAEYFMQMDTEAPTDELDLRLRVDLLARGRLRWLAGYARWTGPDGVRSSQFQTQLRFVL